MLILFLSERKKFHGRPFISRRPLNCLFQLINIHYRHDTTWRVSPSLIQLTNERRRTVFRTSALFKEYQTGYFIFWAPTKCKNTCAVTEHAQNPKIQLLMKPKYACSLRERPMFLRLIQTIDRNICDYGLLPFFP
jgi:hypothetical protein